MYFQLNNNRSGLISKAVLTGICLQSFDHVCLALSISRNFPGMKKMETPGPEGISQKAGRNSPSCITDEETEAGNKIQK